MDDSVVRWTIALGVGVVATVVAHVLLFRAVSRLLGRRPWVQRAIGAARGPARAVVGVTAGWVILGTEGRHEVPAGIRHAWVIATIVAIAWLALRLLEGSAEAALRRHQDVTSARNRTLRTQLLIVRRIGAVVVAVVAFVAILWTFDGMRSLGTSVLASAGVIGVIAGVAAQSTLGNLVAGLQIAFAEPIRLEDAVVVEEEWGWVEEITLTYVVVRLWDLRRLVLPTKWFLENPFQNWTRENPAVVGTVILHVDPSCPFDELREAVEWLVHGSQWFNGESWSCQVVDTTELTAVVRITATATNAGAAWELRCDLREGVLEWLQDEHPDALPRIRTGDYASR